MVFVDLKLIEKDDEQNRIKAPREMAGAFKITYSSHGTSYVFPSVLGL